LPGAGALTVGDDFEGDRADRLRGRASPTLLGNIRIAEAITFLQQGQLNLAIILDLGEFHLPADDHKSAVAGIVQIENDLSVAVLAFAVFQ
jgi:hypothetical protein